MPYADILKMEMGKKYFKEGKLLKQLREHFGLTQQSMASRLGLSLRQYQRYESGEADPVSTDFLKALSKVTGMSVERLRNYFGGLVLESDSTAYYHVSPLIRIPVFDKVGAGIWQGSSENTPIGYIEIPIEDLKRFGLPPERVIGLRVFGNSMEPEIKEGDIVIVADPSYLKPKSGDKVVVWMDGEAVVKVFKPVHQGILLLNLNPSAVSEDFFIPKNKIKDIIVAKVIALYRRY